MPRTRYVRILRALNNQLPVSKQDEKIEVKMI